jgi:hypothetical protein
MPLPSSPKSPANISAEKSTAVTGCPNPISACVTRDVAPSAIPRISAVFSVSDVLAFSGQTNRPVKVTSTPCLVLFGLLRLSQTRLCWVTAEAGSTPSREAAGKLGPPAAALARSGHSGAPPNPISLPPASRYVIFAHSVRIRFPRRGVESSISDLLDERIEFDEERVQSRKRPLKLSMKAACEGFPGSM